MYEHFHVALSFWKLVVAQLVKKFLPVDFIPVQVNPAHILTPPIATLHSNSHIHLHVVSLHLSKLKCCMHLSFSRTCYLSCPSHSCVFDHANIWRRVHVTKLFTVPFSLPIPSSFLGPNILTFCCQTPQPVSLP
jgi:hypothetical protein